MKKIQLFLFFVVVLYEVYSQAVNYNLPAGFKDVAGRAFEKVSPATRQWFIDAAKQHPPGSFDTSWTTKKLKGKFAAEDMDLMGGLFAVMMAYQRMLNKDAREDRKVSGKNKQLSLASKEKKLEADNASIEQGMKEAAEKADNQMTAAQINLWTGVIGGLIQMTDGNVGQHNKTATSVRLPQATTELPDSFKLKIKNTNNKEQKPKEEQEKADMEKAKKASGDSKKTMQDVIRKLEYQLAELGKNTKL